MEHMERKAPKATHLWNKKTPKALESSTFGAFEQLVRMRSAVRIRPAAPERKPPDRVVFCFGKLRCGVEVYPRRGKSAQQLQQFPPKSKCLGGFCYILQLFACFCNLEKRPRYQKTAFYQLTDQLFGKWKARYPLQHNELRVFVFPTGNQLAVYTRPIAIAASSEVLRPLT